VNFQNARYNNKNKNKNKFVARLFKISNYRVGSGGSHSGIAGDSFLVECDTVFLGSFLEMFLRDVMKHLHILNGHLLQ
jgi:hypothetical protein